MLPGFALGRIFDLLHLSVGQRWFVSFVLKHCRVPLQLHTKLEGYVT